MNFIHCSGVCITVASIVELEQVNAVWVILSQNTFAWLHLNLRLPFYHQYEHVKDAPFGALQSGNNPNSVLVETAAGVCTFCTELEIL